MPKYVQKVQLTAGDELEILIAPEGLLPVMSFLNNGCPIFKILCDKIKSLKLFVITFYFTISDKSKKQI